MTTIDGTNNNFKIEFYCMNVIRHTRTLPTSYILFAPTWGIYFFFKLVHTWWFIYEWLTIAYWKYFLRGELLVINETEIYYKGEKKTDDITFHIYAIIIFFLQVSNRNWNRRHYFYHLCANFKFFFFLYFFFFF